MARARTRRFQGTAAQRRRRVWARSTNPLATVTGPTPSATNLLDLFEAASLGRFGVGATIGAIKMTLVFDRTVGATVDSGIFAGIRVGNRSEDPDDMDPSDFLSPAVGAHQDWMWWHYLPYNPHLPDGPVVYETDIKAQRKLDEVGATLWFACRANADTYLVRVTTSTLILLP